MATSTVTYIAFIRGIGPENPMMHREPLTKFFTSLGCRQVLTLQSSGNVLFRCTVTDPRKLEQRIETAMPKQLGFFRPVMVRSRADLEAIVKSDPFRGVDDSRNSQCNLVFVKDPTIISPRYTLTAPDKTFRLRATRGGAIACVHDVDRLQTTKLMVITEKTFGKDCTMRTWKTIHRILRRFNEMA